MNESSVKSKARCHPAGCCAGTGEDACGWGLNASYRWWSLTISYETCFSFPCSNFFTPIKLANKSDNLLTSKAFPLNKKRALKARRPSKAPLRMTAAIKGPEFFIFPRPSMKARFASTLTPKFIFPLSPADTIRSEKSVIFHRKARLFTNVQSLSATSIVKAVSSAFACRAWMNWSKSASDWFFDKLHKWNEKKNELNQLRQS